MFAPAARDQGIEMPSTNPPQIITSPVSIDSPTALPSIPPSDKQPLPKFLKFLHWFHTWPPSALALVYIILGSGVLITPGIIDFIFFIRNPTSPLLSLQSPVSIGGFSLLLWSCYVSILWAVFFACRWAVFVLPAVLRRLVSIVAGREWVDAKLGILEYFHQLMGHIAGIVTAVVSNILAAVLFNPSNTTDSAGNTGVWQQTFGNILQCLVVGTIALTLEKFVLHRTVVGFHRMAYAERNVPESPNPSFSQFHINTTSSVRLTLWYANLDTIIALIFAFCINTTILIVGASAFHAIGRYDVEEIPAAYESLQKYVGQVAATVFAIALLASGLSSTVTGTMAGQIIMSGFLDLKLKPVYRRLGTRLLAILPALIVVLIYGDTGMNDLLILSQIVLSCQLPFAIIPLVFFTSSRTVMAGGRAPLNWFTWIFCRVDDPIVDNEFALLGEPDVSIDGEKFTNSMLIKILAIISSIIVLTLNIYLVLSIMFGWHK